jgi:hypothetical protein
MMNWEGCGRKDSPFSWGGTEHLRQCKRFPGLGSGWALTEFESGILPLRMYCEEIVPISSVGLRAC